MTEQQVTLIKQSWEKVMPQMELAGIVFYQKLFDAAPFARSLFPTDMKQQRAKLMAALSFVVKNAHQLDVIIDKIKQLGERHYHYGAQPEHYEVVGTSLLACLEETCGDTWTPETEDAWKTAFNAIRNIMIVAQEEERQMVEIKTGAI